MGYLVLEDFRGGLDARKFRLAAPAGTLTEAINGHITSGAEFEKRKAFVRVANPTEATSLPAGTFWLLPVATGILAFGSDDLAGADYPAGFAYQRLQHPSVLFGSTYSAGNHAMTEVLWAEVYGGKAFVIARFADTRAFCYFDGTLVSDFTAGLILPHLAAHNVNIATHLVSLIDALENYSAVQVTMTVTGTAAGSGGKVRLTYTPAQTIPTGTKVRVSGVGGTVEANGDLLTATFVDSTHIDLDATTYANAWTAGGTIVTALLDVTGPVGVDYDLELTPDSAAGTFDTPAATVSPVFPVAGTPATGYFKIVAGSQASGAATAAAGSIVGNSAPTAGEYVIVGNKKYTFRATPAIEGEVRINGTSGSFTNLQRAINRSGGTPGTDYVIARPHPYVAAGAITGGGPYTIPLTAAKGLAGVANSVSGTAGNGAGAAWTFNAFTGGTGNCVASVKVVDLTGNETELLGAAVDWTSTNDITAGLVAAEINTETSAGLSHGFSAEADGNKVIIYSPLATAADKNNWRVQVTAGGNVCIGECMFYLVQVSTSAGLNSIRADGQDLVVAGTPYLTYPAGGTLDSLDELYAQVAADIRARSLISGFTAFATATYVQLSRVTTRSDDIDTTVYITPSGTPPSFGVKFGDPPPNPTPLTVELPNVINEVVDVPNNTFQGQELPNANIPVRAQFVGTTIVTVTPAGGGGVYTYTWRAAYAGAANISIAGEQGGVGGQGVIISGVIEPVVTNQANTLFRVRFTNNVVSGINLPSPLLSGLFVCEVSDGTNVTVSEPVTVVFKLA